MLLKHNLWEGEQVSNTASNGLLPPFTFFTEQIKHRSIRHWERVLRTQCIVVQLVNENIIYVKRNVPESWLLIYETTDFGFKVLKYINFFF